MIVCKLYDKSVAFRVRSRRINSRHIINTLQKIHWTMFKLHSTIDPLVVSATTLECFSIGTVSLYDHLHAVVPKPNIECLKKSIRNADASVFN